MLCQFAGQPVRLFHCVCVCARREVGGRGGENRGLACRDVRGARRICGAALQLRTESSSTSAPPPASPPLWWRLLTVRINTQLLILSAAAAAAREDLHEAPRRRSTIPLRPGSDSTFPSFSRLPRAIILFTKCPYPSAGSESIFEEILKCLR